MDSDTALVFGGLGLDGTLNDVWEYRVVGKNWTRLHEGDFGTTTVAMVASANAASISPSARVGHSACVMSEDLYIFGGYSVESGNMNDIWVFNREAGTWSEIELDSASPVPAPRSGSSIVAPDPTGTVFILFGGDGKDDVWDFDVKTAVWTMLQGESVAVTSGGGRSVGLATVLTAVFFIFNI